MVNQVRTSPGCDDPSLFFCYPADTVTGVTTVFTQMSLAQQPTQPLAHLHVDEIAMSLHMHTVCHLIRP